jgi:hypothetical protein
MLPENSATRRYPWLAEGTKIGGDITFYVGEKLVVADLCDHGG